jgi:hypothetical protein
MRITINCVNRRIEGRSRMEYRQANIVCFRQKQKENYEENKERYQEYHRKYNETHREAQKLYDEKYRRDRINEIKQRRDNYREKNKETIREKANTAIICEDCGSSYTRSNKGQHLRSKRHIKAVEDAKKITEPEPE